MAKMFKKGELITTVDQLMECRTDGTGYVFYKDRPLAFSFIGNMNLFTITGGLANKLFHKAIKKPARIGIDFRKGWFHPSQFELQLEISSKGGIVFTWHGKSPDWDHPDGILSTN